MPRLARKNIKVFAGSATNNGVFGSLQANNPTITSDVEQIQSLTAWGEGWNAATETSEELPPLEEIQGVEYVTTYQQAYIMQEGIPEWAATVTYYKGSLAKEVTSTGFRIYNSLTDNNTGNLLSDTSNWKKVMDSDDLYAFDSTVVHDTGNETIEGIKTFSGSGSRIRVQNPTVTYNTAPGSDTFTGISFRDKNGDEMGVLGHVRHPNNDTTTYLAARGADGNWSTSLTVGIKADGTSYTSVRTPSASDNSNQIATTSFVQTTASGLVHKTGYETIEGVKTFSSSPLVPTPSSGDNSQKTASTAFVKAQGYANDSSVVHKTGNETISGTKTFSAATYGTASDAVNSIVTTIGINKSSNGYVKLGNGLIIQWGFVTIDSYNATGTTTFLTSFSSAYSYSLAACGYRAGENGQGYLSFSNKSNTGFSWRSNAGTTNYNDQHFWIAIGF